MAFIWQSAPDIRDKLQRLENLQNYILQDLLKEAEKIYNKRETPEEKEERLRKLQEERDDKILKGIAEKQRESDWFKNSPTLFDEVLHRDLVPFRKFHPDLILLQYVDDLLLAARTPKECTQVESIVKQPPDRCLSNAHMTHNQALLLDMDRVQFGPANSLNPAGARSPGPARLSANIGGNVWNSTGPDRSVTRGS
ncbi:hypothetical protein STEG23_029145 [Scotinomys teguina]